MNTKDRRKGYLEYEHLEDAPMPITICYGERMTIQYANQSALSLFISANRDFLGNTISEIFPDAFPEEIITQICQDCFTNGQATLTKSRRFIKSGQEGFKELWFDISSHPLRDDANKVIAVISYFTDVTDKVQTKVAFPREHHLGKLFKNAPVAIVCYRGLEFFVDFANDKALEMWGKTLHEVQGRKIDEIFPEVKTDPIIRQRHAESVANLKQGEIHAVTEVELAFTRNGALHRGWFNYIHEPYRDDAGKIIGMFAVAIEVTEQVLARNKLIVKTEKELQNAIRQLQDAQKMTKLGSWEWNIETGVVEWSHEMYRIYGYSDIFPVDFDKATERMRPEDAERSKERTKKFIADALARFKATGERYFDISPIEFTVYLPDGTEKQLRSSGKIELTEKGEIYRMLGAIQDVTEIRSTERQLALTNAELHDKNTLLDSILSNSSNGISVSRLIFEEAGEVIDAQTILANDAAVKYAGLPKDLYLTKRATFFDSNIIASPYGQACIKTLKSGEPFITQYFLPYSSRWLELTVSRMDESHLIHIFTDVTEVKEAQLKLEQSLKNLQKSNANLEGFAYAASHDLKEPLRKFQIYIDRLKEELKEVKTENKQKLFVKLDSTSSRMQSLVNNLLEYSSVTNGVALVEQVELNRTVQNVLEDLEMEIQDRRAKIVVPTLPTVQGNARQFEQVFQNLIGNALKYSQPGLPPNVEIIYKQVSGRDVLSDKPLEVLSREYHLIEILDNGIGFEEVYADRIFNIFTRLHGNEDYKGSGIGLSIVRKVIESHNGLVWATSQPDVGSSFKLLLPIG